MQRNQPKDDRIFRQTKKAVENMSRGACDATDVAIGTALSVGDGILDFFVPRSKKR